MSGIDLGPGTVYWNGAQYPCTSFVIEETPAEPTPRRDVTTITLDCDMDRAAIEAVFGAHLVRTEGIVLFSPELEGRTVSVNYAWPTKRNGRPRREAQWKAEQRSKGKGPRR